MMREIEFNFLIDKTMDYFSRSFDIDGMLDSDAKWLAEQIRCKKLDFVSLAKKLDLRQEDWDTFWKVVREQRRQEDLFLEVENSIGELQFLLDELEVKLNKLQDEI